MAIVDKLRQILGYKNDIKGALLNKVADVTDDMSTYSLLINKIDTINDLLNNNLESCTVNKNITTARYLFYKKTKLKYVYGTLGGPEAYGFNYMFAECTSLLKAPELPNSSGGTSAYDHMFYKCTSLTEAPDLPATYLIDSCYNYMFSQCTALQKTGIIAAAGKISTSTSYMFTGCSSLRETTWTATTPPTIASGTWSGCPEDMIIYVPDEAVEAYKAASVWSSRAAYIKPISEKPTA